MSRMLKSFFMLFALALASAVFLQPAYANSDMDIVDTAVADGRFTTLVAALQATGLDEVLRTEGPFTVFAPTDDAFAALGEDTINALLADPDLLTDILLYHVKDAREYKSNRLINRNGLTMANGKWLNFSVRNGNLFVGNAQVTIANVQASNGVIHVIDAVLIPPQSIVDTAIADGRFTTLVAALQATGLDAVLRDEERNFTVFAPTDDAFAALGEDTINALINDPDTLSDILLYHVIADRKYYDRNLAPRKGVTMANGDWLYFNLRQGGFFVGGAKVIITNIQTTNGLIHVIDAVLIPPAN